MSIRTFAHTSLCHTLNFKSLDIDIFCKKTSSQVSRNCFKWLCLELAAFINCHFKLINIAEEEIEDDKESWVEHVRDGGDGGVGGDGGDGEDGKHGGAGGDQARDGGDGRQLEFHILHNRVPIRYGNNFVKSVFTNYC